MWWTMRLLVALLKKVSLLWMMKLQWNEPVITNLSEWFVFVRVCVCARVCVGQICMRKATERFSSGKGIKEEMEKTRHQHKIKLKSFLWDGCLFFKKRGLNKNSLMYPRSTEGRGEALVLLQVGQGVVVELHGLARKPPAEFIDAFLHPVKWSLC